MNDEFQRRRKEMNKPIEYPHISSKKTKKTMSAEGIDHIESSVYMRGCKGIDY